MHVRNDYAYILNSEKGWLHNLILDPETVLSGTRQVVPPTFSRHL